jgi:hypothetical protein
VGSLSLPLVYVQDIVLSSHQKDLVYVVFNNHKNGDFKPYIYKSTNGGKSWEGIASDLPNRGTVYSLVEDPINPDLLFAGTEFGLFFTLNGGENWAQLKGGLPTIAVKDIAIQERENDLVLATFGRGFYVLDNYSPLRELNYVLEQEAAFFSTKPGLLFQRANIGGMGYKGGQHYRSKNPPMGVTFQLHLAEGATRVKDARPEANNELPHYPTMDQLRAEDWEETPYLLYTIKDDQGSEVARFTRGDFKGIERFTWNAKYSSKASINSNGEPKTNPSTTTFVKPGTYHISVMRSTNGELKELISDHEFEVNHLYNYEEIDYEFNAKIDEVYAEANRIEYEFNELKDELNELRAGFRNTVGASTTDLQAARGIDVKLKELSLLLNGDPSRTKREMETVPSLGDVVGILAWGAWNHRGAPTGSMKNMLEDAQAMIKDAARALESIEEQIDELEEKAQNQGVPYWD